MKLFYREYGSRGQPLIILHGLFGSSDNWMTQAKMFSAEFHVYVPDQRNHGQSPHSNEFDYNLLADDLHEFILTNAINSPIILGHSMGGKAAMFFSLAHPELVSKLVVADMSPRSYAVHHDKILEGLVSLPVTAIGSRNEADEILAANVPEADVRQFLLKNLQRKTEGGFSWKINLESLNENIEKIGAAVDASRKFEKPALFIHGRKSNYVRPDDLPVIKNIFPKAQIISLDTGHWIQAEKPGEFVEAVMNFLKEG